MLDLAPISTSTARGFLRKYGLLEIWIQKKTIVFWCQKPSVTFRVNITSQPHHPRKSIAHSGFQNWSSGNFRAKLTFILLKSCPASSCRFTSSVPLGRRQEETKHGHRTTFSKAFATSKMLEIVGGKPTLSRKPAHLTFGLSTSNNEITCPNTLRCQLWRSFRRTLQWAWQCECYKSIANFILLEENPIPQLFRLFSLWFMLFIFSLWPENTTWVATLEWSLPVSSPRGDSHRRIHIGSKSASLVGQTSSRSLLDVLIINSGKKIKNRFRFWSRTCWKV